ncbi:MAG: glycosyltransferase family 87 protein [Gammaproteobacteria bacterium]|nr:glycosyltransferase family 87 protein [Gammaproteobacteria bacterium]
MKMHDITTWVTSDGNLNPPFFTLLLLPLHVFNYAKAYQVWNIVSAICLVSGVHVVLRRFPQWHKNTLIILALFMLYLPTSAVFAYGQVTGLLLLLLGSAWILSREQRDISAGVCIGLACAIKLFCGLFLIYFLCLNRWRLFFSALVVFFLAFLSGLMVFGLKAYLTYHTMLSSVRWYAASWNASFFGFFIRVFSGVEKNIPFVSAPYVTKISTLLCTILLVAYLIRTWRKWGEQKFDLSYSLVIVSMLLLSPLGWVYYFPLLLIPYLVLVEEGNELVHLGLCVLLFLSTLTGRLLRTTQIKTHVQIFVFGGMGFYVLLSVLALLSIVGYGVWHSRVKNNAISENLWMVIYTIIFIPSVISLGAIFRDVYFNSGSA